MIVDGRAIAARIVGEVREAKTNTLTVDVISIAPTAATESYLKIKIARAKDAGMELRVTRLPDSSSEDDIITAINDAKGDALIVQLPLPERLDTKRVLDTIPKEKDADVLSSLAQEAFLKNSDALAPPVALAVEEILRSSRVDPRGKSVAVIGQGMLVGRPVRVLLSRLGATVDVFDKGDDYLDRLKNYDILVSGAGVPGLIKKEMIREGSVIIDAGTSESHGVIVGDVDPSCSEKASVFTPVPGGVGPVAVACLFRNVAYLKHESRKCPGACAHRGTLV